MPMPSKNQAIAEINGDIFRIEFDDGTAWWYPIGKCLEIRREERLKELGL